jgi:hypothetical protein
MRSGSWYRFVTEFANRVKAPSHSHSMVRCSTQLLGAALLLALSGTIQAGAEPRERQPLDPQADDRHSHSSEGYSRTGAAHEGRHGGFYSGSERPWSGHADRGHRRHHHSSWRLGWYQGWDPFRYSSYSRYPWGPGAYYDPFYDPFNPAPFYSPYGSGWRVSSYWGSHHSGIGLSVPLFSTYQAAPVTRVTQTPVLRRTTGLQLSSAARGVNSAPANQPGASPNEATSRPTPVASLPSNARVRQQDGRTVYEWQGVTYSYDWQSQRYVPLQ